MIKNKVLGSILILAGTAIGGGMLAFPLTSAAIGFETSVLLMLALWAVMTYTALLTLEVTLQFPKGANFATMSLETLGPVAKKITLFAVCGLFYSLLAAYFTGTATFLKNHLDSLLGYQPPHILGIVLMTVLFALLVSWKTSAVDIVNKLLFGLKLVTFGMILALVLPKVHGLSFDLPTLKMSALWIAVPVFFTAFGFHGSIPSIIAYMGKDFKDLPRIFLIGSIIPLIAYIGWQMCTLGVLSPDSLQTLVNNKGEVDMLGQEIYKVVGSSLIQDGFNLFAELALLTSVLGVSLGLFDFFKDLLHKNETLSSKGMVTVITFLPPALFAIFYPAGFIAALGFASIFLAILAIFLPVLMAHKLRSSGKKGSYQVAFGSWGLWIAFLIGIGVVVIEVGNLL